MPIRTNRKWNYNVVKEVYTHAATHYGTAPNCPRLQPYPDENNPETNGWLERAAQHLTNKFEMEFTPSSIVFWINLVTTGMSKALKPDRALDVCLAINAAVETGFLPANMAPLIMNLDWSALKNAQAERQMNLNVGDTIATARSKILNHN
jgi:hypothetical protein